MKTLTPSDARKKGLESFEFRLFCGTLMIAYYENTPVEKGDGYTSPNYGGFITLYYIVREKDNKIFPFNIIKRHEGMDNFIDILEDTIGENYGY